MQFPQTKTTCSYDTVFLHLFDSHLILLRIRYSQMLLCLSILLLDLECVVRGSVILFIFVNPVSSPLLLYEDNETCSGSLTNVWLFKHLFFKILSHISSFGNLCYIQPPIRKKKLEQAMIWQLFPQLRITLTTVVQKRAYLISQDQRPSVLHFLSKVKNKSHPHLCIWKME